MGMDRTQVGRNLKALRERAGLSFYEAKKAVKLDRRSWALFERGEGNPGIWTLEKWVEACDGALSELFMNPVHIRVREALIRMPLSEQLDMQDWGSTRLFAYVVQLVGRLFPQYARMDDLAQAAGMDAQALRDVVTGTELLGDHQILQLASFTGLTPGYFRTGKATEDPVVVHEALAAPQIEHILRSVLRGLREGVVMSDMAESVDILTRTARRKNAVDSNTKKAGESE